MGVNVFFHQQEVGINSVPPLIDIGENRGNESVAIDMTASVANQLAWPDKQGRPPLCLALKETLGAFGVYLETAKSPTHVARIIAHGDTSTFPHKAEELFHRRHAITHKAYPDMPKYVWDKIDTERQIASIADKMSVFPNNASLMFSLGKIIVPSFAELSTHHEVAYVIGRRSGEPVIANDQPLGRYETYDIGGMEIDISGRTAADEINHRLAFNPQTLRTFYAIAKSRDQAPVANTMREALLTIDQLNFTELIEESRAYQQIRTTNAPLRIPRDICQSAQKIAEKYGCEPEKVFEITLENYVREQLKDFTLRSRLKEIEAERSKLLPAFY